MSISTERIPPAEMPDAKVPGTKAAGAKAPHTKWGIAALYGLVGSLLVGILVLAFSWPAATAKAQNLPVGISGPSAQVTQLEEALARQNPSPFALQNVASRADAVSKIQQREIYGAILLGSQPEVLLSSAASPVAAQALRAVGTQLQTQISTAVQQALEAKLQGIVAALKSGQVPALGESAASAAPTVTVTDVVPLAAADPNGSGLAVAAFPLVLGGILGGVLISLLVAGAIRRLVSVAALAVGGGVAVAAVLQSWFGILQGSFALNALAIGLSMAATAALIVGLNALIGPAGIGVGAFITMLIANPIAGATMPWQFVPAPWGAVGQFFVPGAANTLVRSLSYFPDAATAAQWLTLAAWLTAGVILAIIGHFRDTPDMRVPASQLEA